MILSQVSERAPPPTASALAKSVPASVSTRWQSAKAKATPSITAWARSRRSVDCESPTKEPRAAALLCGVRSPER